MSTLGNVLAASISPPVTESHGIMMECATDTARPLGDPSRGGICGPHSVWHQKLYLYWNHCDAVIQHPRLVAAKREASRTAAAYTSTSFKSAKLVYSQLTLTSQKSGVDLSSPRGASINNTKPVDPCHMHCA